MLFPNLVLFIQKVRRTFFLILKKYCCLNGMYCCGTDIILDLIAATYHIENKELNEVSSQVARKESEEHRKIEDIARLPLKLPFPSLPLKRSQQTDIENTTQIVGPDGNVCF